MTNTQIHPAKRVITFIMALLMILSSFVYLKTPPVDSAYYEAANEANWIGWYECYRHPNGLDSHGYAMLSQYNPLGHSGTKITSDNKHTNAGWDDFVAVSSKGYTYPGGYDITMAIKTGKETVVNGETYTNYIADSNGHGAFSVGIMEQFHPSFSGFNQWSWGVQFGFWDTPGYVLTFKASALATAYYNRCVVYRDGIQVAEVPLPDNLVMANGTANTNIKLVKCDEGYKIHITGLYAEPTDIYTITDLSPNQKLYYGVGAFCCGQNIVNNVAQYIRTSPSFSITKLGKCSGVVGATEFTSGEHDYTTVITDNYSVQKCQNTNCSYYGEKTYNVTYNLNGGKNGPDPLSYPKAFQCNNNPDVTDNINISPTVPQKDGYAFTGWLCSYDDNVYPASGNVSVPGHVTFTAQWAPLYTLELNGNGGTIDGNSTKTYPIYYGQTYKSAFNNSFPTPERDGYQFKGYYYNDDFTLTEGNWGNTYSVASNSEVSAVWECLHPESKLTQVETKAPTCMATGTANVVCGQCNTIVDTVVLATIPHNYEWGSQGESKGYELYKCSECNDFTHKRIKVILWSTDNGEFDGEISTYREVDRVVATSDENASVPIFPYEGDTPEPSPKLATKKFAGWSVNNDSTVDSSISSPTNTAVYAVFVNKESHTLKLYANGGKFTDNSTEKEYSIIEGQSYESAFNGSFPEPQRTGYTFSYFSYNDGEFKLTNANWGNTYSLTDDGVMYAIWTPHTYTVYYNPGIEGIGQMSSSTFTYDVESQLSKNTFTRSGHVFTGWVDGDGNTYTDEQSVKNLTAINGGTITLTAQWEERNSNTITFYPTGTIITYDYYDLDENKNPASTQGAIPDDAEVSINGKASYEVEIYSTNGYYNNYGDFPVPEYEGYVLDHWFGQATDGSMVVLTEEEWETGIFDKTCDVVLFAVYRCDHKYHGYNWKFTYKDDKGTDKRYDLAYHDNPMNPEDTVTVPDPENEGQTIEVSKNEHDGPYFRHEGVCNGCGQIAAFGYNVQFLASNNGGYLVTEREGEGRPGDILLSYGVPQNKLFTLENGGYDEDGFVIDYLEDGLNPVITIKFDPLLKAQIDKDVFDGWIVDYTFLGYRSTASGNYQWKNFMLPADQTTGELKWTFDYTDTDFTDGRLTSTHLRLGADYQSDVHEVVFDSNTNTDGTAGAPNGDAVIVDTNLRYGVMAIRNQATYQNTLHYIPTAKHTGSDGTLYCSTGWRYSYDGGNAYVTNASWFNQEQEGISQDIILHANYTYYKDKTDDDKDNPTWHTTTGGFLTTYYANNKYAHMNYGTYNKAYFDPDTNIGGTMYYMYYKVGADIKCEPLFAYDPDEDYTDAKTCKVDPGETGYSSDFNINAYEDYWTQYDRIIAKEPKRYTMYISDGVDFVFPMVVCDPQGRKIEYNPSSGFDFDNVGVPEDSAFKNVEVTVHDRNYYTELPKDSSNNVKNFILARVDHNITVGNEVLNYSSPVMNIYTEKTMLGSYTLLGYPYAVKDLKMGLLPLNHYTYENGKVKDSYRYNPIYPFGTKGNYFDSTSGNNTDEIKPYVDYNTNTYNEGYTVYGSGLELTYPDSRGEHLKSGFREQYAYYQQWSYSLKFDANYPSGQKADGHNGSYSGGSSLYTMIGSWSDLVFDNELFTCDSYVITAWNTQPDGKGESYPASGSYNEYVGSLKTPPETIVSEATMTEFPEPGTTLYAQWTRVVNFTLVEGGSGADTFAWVTYTDAVSGTQTDSKVTETKTFRCLYGTSVSITNVAAATNNEFAYFTWNNTYKNLTGGNNVDLRKKADRILTNKNTYSFIIVGHSAITAQFVKTGSTGGFYIDRNNKLLRPQDETWQLYTGTGNSRNAHGPVGDTIDGARYYRYSYPTTVDDSGNTVDITYTVTVNNAYPAAMSTAYKGRYDDVVTLMTSPVNGTLKFVGWQINQEYVSYDPVYKHRVTGDVTVSAVYSSSYPVTLTPQVTVVSNADDAVVLQRSAPDGYKLVESGFLLVPESSTYTATTEITFDELSMLGGTYRLTTTDTNVNGSFKLRLAAGTYYGYGYAVYSYKDGNETKLTTVITDWLTI